jgi:hypothetical protein
MKQDNKLDKKISKQLAALNKNMEILCLTVPTKLDTLIDHVAGVKSRFDEIVQYLAQTGREAQGGAKEVSEEKKVTASIDLLVHEDGTATATLIVLNSEGEKISPYITHHETKPLWGASDESLDLHQDSEEGFTCKIVGGKAISSATVTAESTAIEGGATIFTATSNSFNVVSAGPDAQVGFVISVASAATA